MSLIRKHGAVLQAWAGLALVFLIHSVSRSSAHTAAYVHKYNTEVSTRRGNVKDITDLVFAPRSAAQNTNAIDKR